MSSSAKAPHEKRNEKSERQLLYRSLTDVIGRGDAKVVDDLLATAYRNGNLDESLVRIGLQTAARKNNASLLHVIVAWAVKASLVKHDDLLRIGLQEAAKLGLEDAARVMLEHGAKTDIGAKGVPVLWWSVSQPETPGHVAVTRLLLKGRFPGCPANKEWKDDDGRTIFMSAAWRGHHGSLELLLDDGANVNARDKNDRTILHNLAAGPSKNCRWDGKILDLLLSRPIDIEARDDKRRTALHWAASTGKVDFAKKLLQRHRYPSANPNRKQSRGKTSLHLACDADTPSSDMVTLLLRHGADIGITSDGGWTCLHYAARVRGSLEVIHILLSQHPALLNVPTSTGMTALHVAAQAGHVDVVKCLLSFPDTKIQAKDAYHCTPLLRAAGSGHSSVVEILAPYNNTNRLTPYALDACRGFEATVVDFRIGSDHQNIVDKQSVYDVLYGKEDNGDHVVTTAVRNMKTRSSKPQFRWIHLPANNIAWVEALLAKSFVEDGSSDIDGFQAVEKTFSQQHRGPQYHSHFMRPLCNRCTRGSGKSETLSIHRPSEATREHRSKAWDRYMSSPERVGRSSGHTSGHADPKEAKATHHDSKITRSDSDKGENALPEISANTLATPRGTERGRRTKPGTSTRGSLNKAKTTIPEALRGRNSPRTDSFPISEVSFDSPRSTPRGNTVVEENSSDIVFFMPYLHYETMHGRRQMRDAVRRAEVMSDANTRTRPNCHDEELVFAHLQSTTGLHLRRTLDQFYLHGIDTDERDADQVVGRYTRAKGPEEKIFMVDQLWLLILGPELIITAFPQRWRQPKDDPLDVLDGILQNINADPRSPVSSVYDLAASITARCSGTFDRHRPDDEDYQFLDIFESSIGKVSDQETTLYSKFYKASAEVHTWLKSPDNIPHEGDGAAERTLSPIHHRYPPAVDQFLDIGAETRVLQEIKDIRDELNMISMVLNHQKTTLPSLFDAVSEDLSLVRSNLKIKELKKKFDEQRRLVNSHVNEISRMSELAGMIERSIINLLDLKQKQSNAFEARFARDQAAGTVRQGE